MAIDVRWFDKERGVLLWEVSSDWQVNDLYTASEKSHHYRAENPTSESYFTMILTPPDSEVPR
ncbi:MAG: hypothetical protein AAF125_21670, partial [Chloroflexota bacterium]